MKATEEELQQVNEIGPRVSASIREFFDEPKNVALVERLRPDVVYRHAPDPRDRHPHGARVAAGRHPAYDIAGDASPDPGGHRPGSALRAGGHAADRAHPVRTLARRPSDSGRGLQRDLRRGSDRRLSARPPRAAIGSDGRPPLRLAFEEIFPLHRHYPDMSADPPPAESNTLDPSDWPGF